MARAHGGDEIGGRRWFFGRAGPAEFIFFSPLPLLERVAKSSQRAGAKRSPMTGSARLRRVRGLNLHEDIPPHPPRSHSFARHPLPQGERGTKGWQNKTAGLSSGRLRAALAPRWNRSSDVLRPLRFPDSRALGHGLFPSLDPAGACRSGLWLAPLTVDFNLRFCFLNASKKSKKHITFQ